MKKKLLLLHLLAVTFFANAQNVGIGTTTPLQKLHVEGTTFLNGNVGIGASTPAFPLSFGTAIGDKISLWSNSTNSYGFGIQSSLLQIHSDISASDIAFGYGSSSSFTETMRMKGNGIMQFPAFLAKKINLYSGSTGDAGFGVFGNELRIASDYSGADITFGYDNRSLGFTETMRIKGNGNVGLGTVNPAAKLHVSAGDASLALFGPNTYGGQLYVGAAVNQGVALTAQVIASDGNLHLDPAAGKNMYLGYYQARDIFLNPNGGKVGIGTTAPAATIEVNGYTKLGSDAPSIKMKKLTGTTAATGGGFVYIPHGLDNSKILSVAVMVQINNGTYWGPNIPGIGVNFYWYVTINGNIAIGIIYGDSGNIQSVPIKILITYEE